MLFVMGGSVWFFTQIIPSLLSYYLAMQPTKHEHNVANRSCRCLLATADEPRRQVLDVTVFYMTVSAYQSRTLLKVKLNCHDDFHAVFLKSLFSGV